MGIKSTLTNARLSQLLCLKDYIFIAEEKARVFKDFGAQPKAIHNAREVTNQIEKGLPKHWQSSMT